MAPQILALFSFLQVAFSHEPPPQFNVRTWDAADGQPTTSLRGMARTADGYLWLATQDGIVRFDGARFVTLWTNLTSALGDNRISCLATDRAGDLWIGSEGGTLACRRAGEFVPVPVDGRLHGVRLNLLSQDHDGAFWLAPMNAGLVRYRGGACEFFSPVVTGPVNVRDLVQDRRGRWWAIVGTNLVTFEQDRWQPPTNVPLLAMPPIALAAAADGGLWVATWHPQPLWGRGACIYKLRDGQWQEDASSYPWPQGTKRTSVQKMLEDTQGRLWVGLRGAGVFCREPTGYWHRPGPAVTLNEVGVRCLLEDPGGVIWIGTEAGEVHRAQPRPLVALALPTDAEQRVVQACCAGRDGSLWVATDGAGVFRYLDGQVVRYGSTEGLTNDQIKVIYEDRQTNLWVGTEEGLYSWDGQRFVAVLEPPVLRDSVLTLCNDARGNLWVGSLSGVVRLGPDGTRVFGKAEGVDHNYVRALAEDREGRIWMALTDRGLYLLDADRQAFKRYGAGLWPGQIGIRALHADRDGALWIATEHHGLTRLKDGRFASLSARDGLPSDELQAITEDAAGNLWLSSNQGIFGCARSQLESHWSGENPALSFYRLTVADGLVSKRCTGIGQPTIGRASDGRLWVPNQHALIGFDPAAVRLARHKYPALIEELVVDGIPGSPSADGVFRIPSAARRLEFRYTSPLLSAPELLRFRIRLTGYDPDWVDVGTQRAANYQRVPPGQYRFQVEAGGLDGAWHASPHPLLLEVVPRLVERPGFQWTVALASLAGLAVFIWTSARVRLRRRVALLEARQSVERERARIARDLHDDIGSRLTELVLMSESVHREATTLSDMQAGTREVTRKLRRAVAAMDQVVWTVNPEQDDLSGLVDYLSNYAEEFLAPTPIRCRLDVADDLPDVALPAHVRSQLLLAVKEAMNNGVKHARASELWLRIHTSPDELCIQVDDNGCGFEKDRIASQGLGLRNMSDRLESVGGTAIVRSRVGRGTSVEFRFPLASKGKRRTSA